MVYDAKTYSEAFLINGKKVGPETIKVLARRNQLPSWVKVYRFGKIWIFEVQEIPDHIKNNFHVMLRPKPKQDSQCILLPSDQQ